MTHKYLVYDNAKEYLADDPPTEEAAMKDKDFSKFLSNLKPSEYPCTGIRYQDKLHGAEIGKELEWQSYYWEPDADEPTDELLPGVCAVNYPDRMRYIYGGRYMLLLGDYDMSFGEDGGEIIMHNPIVLDIIDRQ